MSASLIFNKYSFIILHIQVFTYTSTHMLHQLGHIIHFYFIRVNILLYLFFWSLSLIPCTCTTILPLTPIPLPCLPLSTCFQYSHNTLYAHTIIYMHKHRYVLYRGHNYKNGFYYIPFSVCFFHLKIYYDNNSSKFIRNDIQCNPFKSVQYFVE